MTEQISPDGQWKWDGSQWVPNTYVYGEQPAVAAPPPQAWGPPPPSHGDDWKPIASLVCGIAAYFVGLTSIAAVILGHMARADAAREGRRVNPMATIGLILGYTFIAFVVVILVVVLGVIANL
jgi:hypothetical protein